MMSRGEAIQLLLRGKRISIKFSVPQTDGELQWNTEEWSYSRESSEGESLFSCCYDGAYSTEHDVCDLENAFLGDGMKEIESIEEMEG